MRGCLSMGLCPVDLCPGRVSVQGFFFQDVSVHGVSVQVKGLCLGGQSLSRGSLSRAGLCPRGVSICNPPSVNRITDGLYIEIAYSNFTFCVRSGENVKNSGKQAHPWLPSYSQTLS